MRACNARNKSLGEIVRLVDASSVARGREDMGGKAGSETNSSAGSSTASPRVLAPRFLKFYYFGICLGINSLVGHDSFPCHGAPTDGKVERSSHRTRWQVNRQGGCNCHQIVEWAWPGSSEGDWTRWVNNWVQKADSERAGCGDRELHNSNSLRE